MPPNGSLCCISCVLCPKFDINSVTRAIIKKASPDNEAATENLDRERQSYLFPSVASATCFRQMYDVINSHTIALEWLDTTFADMKY